MFSTFLTSRRQSLTSGPARFDTTWPARTPPPRPSARACRHHPSVAGGFTMRVAILLCSIAALAVGQLTNDALVAHNNYRRMHGAAPLTLAADLTAYAQKWANNLANTGNMVHSSCMLNNQRIGENLAMKWGSGNVDMTGAEASKMWYDEVSKHNFNNNNFDYNTGHFTQLVWKGTKQMGIAKASKNGKVFVAANYRPAGNVQGQFAANVGRRA